MNLSVTIDYNNGLLPTDGLSSLSDTTYFSGYFIPGAKEQLLTYSPSQDICEITTAGDEAPAQILPLGLAAGWSLVGVGSFSGGAKDLPANSQLLAKNASGGLMLGNLSGISRSNLSVTWSPLCGFRPASTPINGIIVATGDLDGTGKDSLVVSAGLSSEVLLNRSGYVAYAMPADSNGMTPVGVGHFSGDGRDEVLLEQPTNGALFEVPVTGQDVDTSQMTALTTIDAGETVVAVGNLSGVGADIITVDPNGIVRDLLVASGSVVAIAQITRLSPGDRVIGVGKYAGLDNEELLIRRADGSDETASITSDTPLGSALFGDQQGVPADWFGGLYYQWTLQEWAAGLAALVTDGHTPSMIHLASGVLMQASYLEVLLGNETVGTYLDDAHALDQIADICRKYGIGVAVEASLKAADVPLWLGAAKGAGLPVVAVEDDQEDLYSLAERNDITHPGLDVSQSESVMDSLHSLAAAMTPGISMVQQSYPSAAIGYWIGAGESQWQDTMFSLIKNWLTVFSSVQKANNLPGISYVVSDNNWFDESDKPLWLAATEGLSSISHSLGIKLVMDMSNGPFVQGSSDERTYLASRLATVTSDPQIKTDAFLWGDEATSAASSELASVESYGTFYRGVESAANGLVAPPVVTLVATPLLQPGQTAVIATVTKPDPSDTLSIQVNKLASGSVTLSGSGAMQQVVYTAFSGSRVNGPSSVAFTVADENNGATASSTTTVRLATSLSLFDTSYLPNLSSYFSPTAYLDFNTDVAKAHFAAAAHYDEYGWREGRNPSAEFDTTLYLLHNPDVRKAGMDPLVHYLEYGEFEGRATYPVIGPSDNRLPGFDPEYYLLANPDVAAAHVDPLWHFITYGWKEGRNPDAYFNTKYYLEENPDVRASGMDPLVHYDDFGWKEGRNPSSIFDGNDYLAANPDVKAAGMNPLTHYLDYGAWELRTIYPVSS